MSDHAKTVARLCAPMPAEAYEALAALVAERDEARQATWAQDTRAESAEMWAEAAEARVTELEAALRLARQDIITVNTEGWDSTRGQAALAAITAIDAALAKEDTDD